MPRRLVPELARPLIPCSFLWARGNDGKKLLYSEEHAMILL
jgi:hypothetical protein